MSFVGEHAVSETASRKQFEKCISVVKRWMSRNKLKVNDSKPEVLITSTRQQVSEASDCCKHISVDTADIINSTCAKNPVRY